MFVCLFFKLSIYSRIQSLSLQSTDFSFFKGPRRTRTGPPNLLRTTQNDHTSVHSINPNESDWRISNDPSAGSPTETLLRLLLPLNDQVRSYLRYSPIPFIFSPGGVVDFLHWGAISQFAQTFETFTLSYLFKHPLS